MSKDRTDELLRLMKFKDQYVKSLGLDGINDWEGYVKWADDHEITEDRLFNDILIVDYIEWRDKEMPLTHDLLEAFGFDFMNRMNGMKTNDGYIQDPDTEYKMYINLNGYVTINDDVDNPLHLPLQYDTINKIKNLWKTLTGKELTRV